MVDPVNLNVPGLLYLLFALAFFAVVVLLSGALSPLELALRHHRRSDGGDDERAAGNDDQREDDRARTDDEDGSGGPTSVDAPVGSDSDTATIYECRHCGTTFEAGDGQCPRCGTPSVARYEIG